MYKAKRGRDGHRVFTVADDSAGDGRLRTIQELRTALGEGQMAVHYQPKLEHPDLAVLHPTGRGGPLHLTGGDWKPATEHGTAPIPDPPSAK